MRIQSLVESPDHVCCRYRLRAFEPAFRAAGHSLDYFPYHSGAWRPFRDLDPAADFVVIQRKLPSLWEEMALTRWRGRILFDFDDAVWLRDSYAGNFHSGKRLRRFRRLMERATGVIAGNSYLAEAAWNCNPGLAVTVVPTCIDTSRYVLARHDGPAVRLVWIGSSSTIRGLERIRPTLERLGREVPGLELKLICDRFPEFTPLKTIACRWSEEYEAAEIATCDIGISWIPDDPWSRGKCGLKLLQYMAAGLPVVANPVGVHPQMIVPGSNGFLAASEDDWIDAIRTLAADATMRRKMGQSARGTVEQFYSVPVGASRWLQFLGGLSARKGAA